MLQIIPNSSLPPKKFLHFAFVFLADDDEEGSGEVPPCPLGYFFDDNTGDCEGVCDPETQFWDEEEEECVDIADTETGTEADREGTDCQTEANIYYTLHTTPSSLVSTISNKMI